METEKNKSALPHSISIDERKSIKVSGVESVTTFSPTQIVLKLQTDKLTVLGDGMKIVGFSKENGVFLAEGKISRVQYGSSVSGLFK